MPTPQVSLIDARPTPSAAANVRLARQAGALADRALLVGLVLALVLASGLLVATWPLADAPTSPALAHALDQAVPGRLVRARTTAWGDLSVEFMLQAGGDPDATRAAGLADLLRIARAVYQPGQPHPLNLTVLGWDQRPAPGAGLAPVLYASLPADRLAGQDWTQVTPDALPSLASLRWLPAAN